MSRNVFCYGFIHWSLVNLPKATPLKEKETLSSSQEPLLSKSSSGRVGVSSPLSYVNAGVLSDLSLCGTYACYHHCCEFIWANNQLFGKLFLCHLLPLGLTVLLPYSSALISDLILGRQKFDIAVLFRDECSAASCSLHVGQLWVSILIIIFCIKKLLLWQLWDPLIYEYNIRSLRVSLI